MHNIPNLFYFGTTLYLFWTVFPSIIRSLRLYIQHHTIQVLWLLASKQPQNLYGVMLNVQSWTSDDRRRDRPKHVECCSKNEINLRHCASGWFYYRNILQYMVLQTSSLSILLVFYISNILRSSSERLYCKCSLIWNIFHTFMQAVSTC